MNVRAIVNTGLKTGVSILFTLSCFAMSPASSDTAERPFRIAIVNVAQLLENSPQSKAANEKLKTDFVPREEALDTEQKAIKELEDSLAAEIESGSLSEENKLQKQRELRDRQRTYARVMDDFREDVRNAREIAIDTLQNQIVQAIGDVREREQIDVVLRESDFIVASDRVDITGKVMQHLQQKFQAEQVMPDAKPKE